MVRLYVNVQFQVKPLSTGTRSSRTQQFFLKNAFMDPQGFYGPPRCVPSLESLAQEERICQKQGLNLMFQV